MPVTPATRLARPRLWPGVVAWTLWALATVAWLVIPWLDQQLRQAGRPDLAQWDLRPGVALASAATVGAVLASRRPAHPVGWLLLAQVAANLATGAAAQYLTWGLLPGGPLPATRYVALAYRASAGGGLLLLGFVLLLTPTGKLPSPAWRWVALAAALLVVAAGAALVGLAVDATEVVTWAISAWVAGLPLAIGAAVLRYRLYDLDRIISRTLAYGLLTLLLGGGYAAVVLGLGRLLGQDSSLVVAAATLAIAGLFQPARRRIQQAVDRRFNRRRHDAATTIQAFSDRLRDQVDLDTLSAELLAVVEETMQPNQASLWLRPQASSIAVGRP